MSARACAAVLLLLTLHVGSTRALAQLGCVPADCNDGIACTTDVCNVLTGVCTHLPVDLVCSDGQFCNGTETCHATLGCQAGTPVACDDGIACTTDACNETLDLCTPAPSDAACDDGLYCNGAETCNLLLGCQAGLPIVCTDLVTCTTDACNEATDQCDHVPDDNACSDGLFCDGVETCDPTLGCQLGTLVTCDDSVACTLDACNEVSDQCDHTAVDALCTDGQFCNGAEVCHATLGCQAGTPPDCADTIGCTTDTCDETLDLCMHATNDAACSNGLYCDGAETCNLLLGCLPGVPPVCADVITCTIDGCNEATDACEHVPDDGACDDGIFCDGAETCNATLGCQLGTLVDCDDGFGCTLDLCNETAGQCDHTPVDALCDDAQFCNGTETCSAAAGCVAGTSPCFPEGCNEIVDVCGACSTDPECDDTLFCNGVETCDAGEGTCIAGTAPSCGDAVACTVDGCDENANACAHTPDHGACANGVFCDGDEVCDETAGCQAGAPADCGGLSGCQLGTCDVDADECVVENLCCGNSIPDAGEDCDPPNVEDCNNGTDDDGDGQRDCIDVQDCADPGNPADGIVTCGDNCNFDPACRPIRSALAQIRFSTFDGPDRLRVRGRLPVATDADPAADGLSIVLANEAGEIYAGALLPGDLQVKGVGFAFKDPDAKLSGMASSRNGIGSARARVKTLLSGPTLKFGMTVYGDFSAATTALMGHQIAIGDDAGFVRAPWTVKSYGWKLKTRR